MLQARIVANTEMRAQRLAEGGAVMFGDAGDGIVENASDSFFASFISNYLLLKFGTTALVKKRLTRYRQYTVLCNNAARTVLRSNVYLH